MIKLEKEFVEMYVEIGKTQGIDELLSKILAYAQLSTEGISLEELAEKTGYSLATISNKTSLLESITPLKRIRKPGTKKIFVKGEQDLVATTKQAIENKQKDAIRIIKEKLPPIIKKAEEKQLSEKEKKRLQLIKEYYKQTLKIEKIISKMLKEFDEITK